ncbi:MAG: hypothetical protein Q8L21_00635 [Candidatus Komeilibacteria bacterium]|nr:hypothetical protein [Candidatus Komeilibacteria bacterium]
MLGLADVARAGSTALSESRFIINGASGSVVSKSITVSNLSDKKQQYSFYPEDAGEESRQSISAIPREFSLLPQQSLGVVVRFRQSAKPRNTNLNLVAYNAAEALSNFRVGDGIKIPVQFAPSQIASSIVKNRANLWILTVLIYGIDFILFSVVCYWCYRRRFNITL